MKITKLTFHLSRTVNTGNYQNIKADFGMAIEMDDEALDVGLVNKEMKHQVDLLLDPDYKGGGTEWLLKDVGGYAHKENKDGGTDRQGTTGKDKGQQRDDKKD